MTTTSRAVLGNAAVFAQLTDTHVGPGEEWQENCRRLQVAVERLNAETVAVDAVVITGDLVNVGAEAEYDVLMELLEPLTAPILVIPGNHDDRANLKRRFPGTPWIDGEYGNWVKELDGLTMIGFDTVKPGAPGAQVDGQRLAWLEEQIAEASSPTILAMHHPPFNTGIRWMDTLGFEGIEQLAELLARHPVDRIICGHYHRPMTGTISGISATIGISTAVHLELDFDPHALPAIIADPFGYQLYRWTDAGSIVSHTRFVDQAGAATQVKI